MQLYKLLLNVQMVHTLTMKIVALIVANICVVNIYLYIYVIIYVCLF